MILPACRDLIKPQWRTILENLKRSGGLPVNDLAREAGSSYMATKIHCEALTKADYLIRTRLPRTEIGRPEIFYSLATKADALFPQAGVDFTLALLEELKLMYGESAPEKLLFQYFQKQLERLLPPLAKFTSTVDRAIGLSALREKEGGSSYCECVPDQPLRIVECHNPLQRIFTRYPRAVAMELRMIEQGLGSHVTRSETPGGRESPPTVVFEISSPATTPKFPA